MTLTARCFNCGKFVSSAMGPKAVQAAGPDAQPLCPEHAAEANCEMAVAGLL